MEGDVVIVRVETGDNREGKQVLRQSSETQVKLKSPLTLCSLVRLSLPSLEPTDTAFSYDINIRCISYPLCLMEAHRPCHSNLFLGSWHRTRNNLSYSSWQEQCQVNNLEYGWKDCTVAGNPTSHQQNIQPEAAPERVDFYPIKKDIRTIALFIVIILFHDIVLQGFSVPPPLSPSSPCLHHFFSYYHNSIAPK